MNCIRKIARLTVALLLMCCMAAPALAVIETHTPQLVNTFNMDDMFALKALAQIEIEKTITATGETTIAPEGFTFELVKKTKPGEAPAEPLTATTDKHGLTMIRLEYGVADIGEHVYLLREVDDKREGVSYDTREYKLHVTVACEGERLTATMALDGIPAEKCVAAFENTYHSLTDDMPFTGDTSNLLLLCGVLALSVGGCIWLYKKKKNA